MNTRTDAEIDLKKIFYYVLLHWRMLIVIGVIGALLGAGFTATRVNQIKQAQESYQTSYQSYKENLSNYKQLLSGYQQQLKEANEYLNSSNYLKMDASNEPITTGTVSVVTPSPVDETTAKQYAATVASDVKNGAFIQSLATEYNISVRDMNSMVALSANTSNDVTVAIIGANEDFTKKVYAQVIEVINSMYSEEQLSENGFYCVPIPEQSYYREDGSLSKAQSTAQSNIATLNNSISTTQKSIDALKAPASVSGLKKTLVKYAGSGFVGLIILSIIWLAVEFVLSGKIHGEREVRYCLNLMKMGDFSQDELSDKKTKNKLDCLCKKKLGWNNHESVNGTCEMIAANIETMIGDGTRVAITGKSTEILSMSSLRGEIEKKVKRTLPEFECNFIPDVISNPNSRRAIVKEDAVILAIKKNQSKTKEVVEEYQYLTDMKVRILGFILL